MRKHGSATSPGWPSYSPVSEKPPMSLNVACPQSSAYIRTSVAALPAAGASHAVVRKSAIAVRGIDLEFIALNGRSCLCVGFIDGDILDQSSSSADLSA